MTVQGSIWGTQGIDDKISFGFAPSLSHPVKTSELVLKLF